MKKQIKQKTTNFQAGNVETNFSGGNITRYSGLEPLMGFLGKQNVFSFFDRWFPTPESNALKFSNTQILLSLLLGSVSGINRLIRLETFTKDCLVARLLKLDKFIDANTIKDRLKKLGQRGSYLLHELSLKMARKTVSRSGLKKIILDLDSTVVECYGNQQGAEKGYCPKKRGLKSYHPLLCFVTELKVVFNTWWRSGSCHTSNGCDGFIDQCFAALPASVKQVWVRADSGFFSERFISRIEQAGHKYLVKVKLRGLKKLLKAQRWTRISQGVYSCCFKYRAKSWDKPRQFFAVKKKIYHGKGPMGEDIISYEYFCYCSNLNMSAVAVHQVYGQRAESENWIAQVKSQLLAGKTLTDNFFVNDMLWQISVMGYNFSVQMRYQAGKSYWKQEHKTFRQWFIELPGKLVRSGRKYYLKLYEHEHDKHKWKVMGRVAV